MTFRKKLLRGFLPAVTTGALLVGCGGGSGGDDSSDGSRTPVVSQTGTAQLSFAEQQQREAENPRIEKMDIALPSIPSSNVLPATTPSALAGATPGGIAVRARQKTVINTSTDVWARNSVIGVYFEFDADSRARFNHPEYYANADKSYFEPQICNELMSFDVCNDRVSATIVEWANAWSVNSNISFEVVTDPSDADMRVGFMDLCGGFEVNCGSWAALGRQQQQEAVAAGRTSINFDWLLRHTVLHEFGHALGLAHEQSNPGFPIEWDLETAVPYFQDVQGWDRERVLMNVVARANGPYLSAGRYDPFSIMHYPVPKRDKLGRLLIKNPEDCPSFSETTCVDSNRVLSIGDRAGIASIYPTIGTLYGEIEEGVSQSIIYATNIDDSAHLLAFNTLDQDLQDEILIDRNGKIEFTLLYSHREVDDDCLLGGFLGNLGPGDRTITSETYLFIMVHAASDGSRTEVKRLPITVNGRFSLGCGSFSSNRIGVLGNVVNLSGAVTSGLR